jgi:hypothetical protein
MFGVVILQGAASEEHAGQDLASTGKVDSASSFTAWTSDWWQPAMFATVQCIDE